MAVSILGSWNIPSPLRLATKPSFEPEKHAHAITSGLQK
eukprot:CAMPEP_0184326116 /NCGR_PEP_ID=MMETSP1049-20130417/142390_1 /TAXON_ID=77928 /ORGANISM="Proteomonas sulcata, Strain CCMP704" /LENGTH=38 /DNA_ID= /DNA_START= /DNA_END= /DNA_ORIENTATION=